MAPIPPPAPLLSAASPAALFPLQYSNEIIGAFSTSANGKFWLKMALSAALADMKKIPHMAASDKDQTNQPIFVLPTIQNGGTMEKGGGKCQRAASFRLLDHIKRCSPGVVLGSAL
ncbi:hypothetical protein FKM82_016278 [Ascaphus truei]